MRTTAIPFLILTLTTFACQSTGTSVPVTPTPVSVLASTSTPSAAEIFTAAPTAPAKGVIFVDTLEQEVYPFVENGKCSLGEAIFAANSGAPKDSCAAGVLNESVIELMPGEYYFTQRDQTPPQGDWVYSTVTVGDALPIVIYSLTIRGNGAKLIREESSEPFRFFEMMFGTLTLKDLTLIGGDVLDDWGGAIYSMNASINLDTVRLAGNSAGNGGGLYLTFGRLTISNSEFIENRAGFAGGGMFIDSAKSEIHFTEFNGNYADGQGGGLLAQNATLLVADSLFIKNVNDGTRGGGMYLENINLTVARSQFYQNQSYYYGGAISVSNPILAGIDEEEGNPIDDVGQSPTIAGIMTSIPGFQATLEAHPSGIFQDFHEDTQIHDSCFANNITINPEDPNWTSALFGSASMADDNYWGDSSGPSGMGPGKGDSVGKRITFDPFLTEMPAFCDSSLAQQK